jgi:hypothetical protein
MFARRTGANGGHGPTSNGAARLGVKDAALGHPRKLLDAIAALRSERGDKLPPLTLRPRQVLQASLPKTTPNASCRGDQ